VQAKACSRINFESVVSQTPLVDKIPVEESSPLPTPETHPDPVRRKSTRQRQRLACDHRRGSSEGGEKGSPEVGGKFSRAITNSPLP